MREHMFFMPRTTPFSEADLRAAIDASNTWVDVLRFLGYVPKGGNFKTVKNWAERWGVTFDHFDPHANRRMVNRARMLPLEEVLVENSTYPRDRLKRRLFTAGLKQPRCELCGQDELWRGHHMALVLDHINGVGNDHRLENLQIVCPNCAATLSTHCGRNLPHRRECPSCGESFAPRTIRHRYCSEACWGAVAAKRYAGIPHPERRKVPRPSHQQLLKDIETMSFVAVGRQYGVSDRAVRKWIRWYERGLERGGDAASAADRPGGDVEPPARAA